MSDVTILYQGGSGGFLLFYYLLLSNNYQTGLEFNSVTDLIDKQFPKTLQNAPAHWKSNEFWPDNLQCKKHPSDKPKLFLICNPCWNDYMIKQNLDISSDTHSILLYTDIKTQLRMAYEKKAYWFTNVSKKQFNAPENDKLYIRQILESAIAELDPEISKVKATFAPTQVLRLQDFLQRKTIETFAPPNKQQIEFIEFWKRLQPKKVQQLL